MSEATSATTLQPLSAVARLILRIGCLLIQTGVSARRAQEAMQRAAAGLGCERLEVLCVSDTIVVEIWRGEERSPELQHLGHQVVNFQLATAVLEVVDRLAAGGLRVETAEEELDVLQTIPPQHPPWLVCLAAGIGCAAFGRLLGADWAAFLPTLAGASIGQWLRHRLGRAHVNLYLSTGIVSFLASILAGWGARLAGSQRVELAVLAAVLLLVPGIAALNAQKDVIDNHIGLGISRAVRVIMVVLFISVGLLLSQHLLRLA